MSGGADCEGSYSKLIDDEVYFDELSRRADVGHGVSPVKLSVRPSGPGLYRLATICLAALCAVLLISIIAVAAHNKKAAAGGGEQSAAETDPQVQRQRQDAANVTALKAALSKLQQEKAELQRERDELLAKLNAKHATTAPEVIKPRTTATTTTTTTAATTSTAPPIVCPDNWYLFNSSCYFISRVSRDWMESQTFCQSKGGHLAIIHSAEEQTFLWDLLPRGHWNAYWFGISDEHTEDEWKWVDGTPLVGGFWEEGEPNNHIDEDCGYIVKTRKLERVAVRSWYDAPCSMYWPFICEKEMETATNTTAAAATAAAQ